MNKRGEEEEGLTANTLGTVLGVTATIIIVLFIYIGITQIIRDTELEAAKTLADKLEAKVNALTEGQSINTTLQGSKDLESWYILGWGKNDPARPDKCFYSSCVCICKGNTLDSCKEKGLCREIEIENIKITSEVEAEFIASIGNYPGAITTRKGTKLVPFVPIPSNLLVIEITKSKDSLTIKK